MHEQGRMTYEEASDILRNAAWLGTNEDREKVEKAVEMAVNALKREMPQVPMQSVDAYNENLIHLYCPNCGSWVGMKNIRLRRHDMYNITNGEICGKCGQVFDLEKLQGEEKAE